MNANVGSEVESAWEYEAERRQAGIESDGAALLSYDEVVRRLRQKLNMQDRSVFGTIRSLRPMKCVAGGRLAEMDAVDVNLFTLVRTQETSVAALLQTSRGKYD
jgi:hypothetical protein